MSLVNKISVECICKKFSNHSNTVVLCDFDGTITSSNVLNTLYRNFSFSNYEDMIRRWEKNEISTKEEIENSFATVVASKTEMELFLNGISIDPDLFFLLKTCKKKGHYFAIVSDGLRWYIEYILSQNGIREVDVFANEIHFLGDGFSFEFPWYDESTPLQGTSKSMIVNEFKNIGYEVVFIGDGHSDIGAALLADHLFARDYLLEYSKHSKINAYDFDNLKDVAVKLNGLNLK